MVVVAVDPTLIDNRAVELIDGQWAVKNESRAIFSRAFSGPPYTSSLITFDPGIDETTTLVNNIHTVLRPVTLCFGQLYVVSSSRISRVTHALPIGTNRSEFSGRLICFSHTYS